MSKTLLFSILGLCFYFILTNGSNPNDQSKPIDCVNLAQCPAKLRQVTAWHNFKFSQSEEQIGVMCSNLTLVLKCYNDYRTYCIDETLAHQRLTNDYNSQAGRHVILANELCSNATFKQDYVALGQCQNSTRIRIQSDYLECQALGENRTESISDKISKIVVDRNQTLDEAEGRYTEFKLGVCCTMHHFNDCVYSRIVVKCGLKSAEAWRKIMLEIFNRKNVRECDQYSPELLPICLQNSNTTTI